MNGGSIGVRVAAGIRACSVALLTLLSACRSEPEPAAPELPDPEPKIVVLIYDRSSSIRTHELEHFRTLTRGILEQVRAGDRLVALEVLQLERAEAPHRWALDLPPEDPASPRSGPRRDTEERARLARLRSDAATWLDRFTDGEERGALLGTDLLSTLQDAAEEIGAFSGDRPSVLILFSDMQQATREMNLEGAVRMPPDGWILDQAREGLLPDLEGTCVLVAGARSDTAPGARVLQFWSDYFDAAGGRHPREWWGYRPPRLRLEDCPPRR